MLIGVVDAHLDAMVDLEVYILTPVLALAAIYCYLLLYAV